MTIVDKKAKEKNITHFESSEIPFPQEPLWADTLEVIHKLAASEGLFYSSPQIAEKLRHNSNETRQRYGSAIHRRLFGHNEIYGQTLIKVARAYQDEQIIEAVWRTIYFGVEPILGKTYLDIIWPREPGSAIGTAEIKNYVRTSWKSLDSKVVGRVALSLKQSNVIRKHGKDYIIGGFANLETPLLILFHMFFAQQSAATTVRLASVEQNNFWKFLGYRSIDHVRVAFRKAEQLGYLARYSVVDNIEQVTTKYSLSSLIEKAPRL